MLSICLVERRTIHLYFFFSFFVPFTLNMRCLITAAAVLAASGLGTAAFQDSSTLTRMALHISHDYPPLEENTIVVRGVTPGNFMEEAASKHCKRLQICASDPEGAFLDLGEGSVIAGRSQHGSVDPVIFDVSSYHSNSFWVVF